MNQTAGAKPIYLDYQATTPIDRRVVEAMLPYLTTEFGNPSSSHAYGRAAARAVQTAREQVAALIGARSPEEIVFTSSGTESNHRALTGAAEALRAAGRGARHHHDDRAPVDPGDLRSTGRGRVSRHPPTGRRRRPTRPGRSRARVASGHRPGLGLACQQRDRHAATAGRGCRTHPPAERPEGRAR